jgi:hypothetical protein
LFLISYFVKNGSLDTSGINFENAILIKKIINCYSILNTSLKDARINLIENSKEILDPVLLMIIKDN